MKERRHTQNSFQVKSLLTHPPSEGFVFFPFLTNLFYTYYTTRLVLNTDIYLPSKIKKKKVYPTENKTCHLLCLQTLLHFDFQTLSTREVLCTIVRTNSTFKHC